MASEGVPIPNDSSNMAPLLSAQRKDNVVIDCDIKELYYGTFKAVRDTAVRSLRTRSRPS